MHWFHHLWLQLILASLEVITCDLKNRFKYDLRKYCFTNRVDNIWNSLPNCAISANTTNVVKNRLDKLWPNQDIIYDFKAQLEGNGSRSEVQ